MARRRAGRDIDGIVLLDKPAGITSNRALQEVRRLLDANKAGHTGTLDPFATGMLPICLGEASKTAGFMLDASKTYRATARLGEATATGDPEGDVTETAPVPDLDDAAIDRALEAFRGRIRQVPPMYSALKHRGQPLYRLARRGEEVERPVRHVTVHRLVRIEWTDPLLTFEVSCSKGTYVRVLAEDIARRLGTCAHLVTLRRLAVEPFDPGGMRTLDDLRQAVEEGSFEDVLLAPDAGLAGWPVVRLQADAEDVFRHGNPVSADTKAGAMPGNVRVHDAAGRVIGLGEVRDDGRLHPRRVFVRTSDVAMNH